MQQILTERHSGTTFKGKLKLYHFKIVKYKTRAFSRKIEIKPFSIVYFPYREQSLLMLLSVFRFGFDAQFHRLCYKTIGSCF